MPLYPISISISYLLPRSHFALVGFFAALHNEGHTAFSFPSHRSEQFIVYRISIVLDGYQRAADTLSQILLESTFTVTNEGPTLIFFFYHRTSAICLISWVSAGRRYHITRVLTHTLYFGDPRCSISTYDIHSMLLWVSAVRRYQALRACCPAHQRLCSINSPFLPS